MIGFGRPTGRSPDPDPRAARSDGGTRSNQNAFYGKVVGGTVVIGNSWSMNHRPIVIAGALVTGFTEDVAYIREVA